MLTQLTPHLSFSVKDQLVTGYRHYSEIPVNSYIRNYCIKTSIKVFYLNIKKKYSTAEIMLWSCWLSRNAVTGIKHFSVLNEMGAKGSLKNFTQAYMWCKEPELTQVYFAALSVFTFQPPNTGKWPGNVRFKDYKNYILATCSEAVWDIKSNYTASSKFIY